MSSGNGKKSNDTNERYSLSLNNKNDGKSKDDNGSKENGKNGGKNGDKPSNNGKNGGNNCKCKEKCTGDNDTKEIRKLFDQQLKSSDPHRVSNGLSMETTKKWFEEADLFKEDFGMREEHFEEAFGATAKGEDRDKVEFLEFIECVEKLADEMHRHPQEIYNQLLTADTPTDN